MSGSVSPQTKEGWQAVAAHTGIEPALHSSRFCASPAEVCDNERVNGSGQAAALRDFLSGAKPGDRLSITIAQ
jgi:hypothetical protein